METSLSQLVLDEGEEEDEEDVDYDRNIKHKTSKPIVSQNFYRFIFTSLVFDLILNIYFLQRIPDRFSLDCAGDYSSSPAWSIDSPKKEQMFNKHQHQSMQIPLPRPSTQFLPPQIPRIPVSKCL